jgi:hypothetical protein
MKLMKDHLDLMTKEFSAMKTACEKERDVSEKLKFQLEETKKALQDEKEKQRDHDGDSGKDQENTALKKLCHLRQPEDDEFDTPRDQVLVHNLPLRTTEQMVKSTFGQHGPVFAVKLYPWPELIAVVEYQNHDSIFKMLQKYNSTGIRLLGNQLKCTHLEY